jgi:hypothetical protein
MWPAYFGPPGAALAAADVTAEALHATAPRPAPGPVSPESEQRIRDLYERPASVAAGVDIPAPGVIGIGLAAVLTFRALAQGSWPWFATFTR